LKGIASDCYLSSTDIAGLDEPVDQLLAPFLTNTVVEKFPANLYDSNFDPLWIAIMSNGEVYTFYYKIIDA
jgi:hypothetical protein